MDVKSLRKILTAPIIISLVVTIVIASLGYLSTFDQEGKTNGEIVFYFFKYILLFFFGVYSIVANFTVLLSVLKSSPKLSGGAITHIGVAMMLLGILFSSGYDQIVSKNYTGILWSSDYPDEVNKNNLLIYQNDPRKMHKYTLNYKGIRKLFEGKGYINQNFVKETNNPEKYIAGQNIAEKNILKGDTLTINGTENSYFEIEYTKDNGTSFTLFPRVQMNEAMGIVYSPDIKRTLFADLYTHVRTFPDPEVRDDWGRTDTVKVRIGETFYLNDYISVLESVTRVNEVDGFALSEQDAAVKAVIRIEGETETYYAEPVFII